MLRLPHGMSSSTQGRMLMPSAETYPLRDISQNQQPVVDSNTAEESRCHPCQCILIPESLARPKHQPLPLHLQLDYWTGILEPISPVLTPVFSTLCVIAYGQRTMEDVWDLAIEDGKLWMESTDRMARRIEATGVTVRSS